MLYIYICMMYTYIYRIYIYMMQLYIYMMCIYIYIAYTFFGGKNHPVHSVVTPRRHHSSVSEAPEPGTAAANGRSSG